MRQRWTSILLAAAAIAVGCGFALLRDEPGSSMVTAAQAFLATLDEKQKAVTQIDYNDKQRLDWHFIPKPKRKGLQVREMNESQKKAALALLRSCVSQVGYGKATQIMELEQILKKLEGDKAINIRDNLRYYFTVFGKPGGDAAWGLSIEGHHLSLNFVNQGDKVVAHTPAFYGANPAEVKGEYGVGAAKGVRVLRKEETLAFELVNSCDASQLKSALRGDAAPKDIRGAGEPQPPRGEPQGLAVAKMTPKQVAVVKALIESYTENMPDSIAKARLAEIEKAGLDKAHFAWWGARKPGIGHYYVLEGPTFQIEFINVQPDAAGNVANHIHSVWRNVAGDFGLSAK